LAKANGFTLNKRFYVIVIIILAAAILVLSAVIFALEPGNGGQKNGNSSLFIVDRAADGSIVITNNYDQAASNLMQSNASVNSITISYTGGMYSDAYTINNKGSINSFGNAVTPPLSISPGNTIGLEKAGAGMTIYPYTPGTYPDGAVKPSHVVVTGIFKNGTLETFITTDV
jgi:hypothetical protein